MLDFFSHGEREVVERVLFFFPLISLKKDQLSSLNKKGVKAIVLGPESSDTEFKDAFEGKYKVGALSSGFLIQIADSKQLPGLNKTKKGNVQYYFEA